MIDKYQAYQLLDDQWQEIAIDLEILQTEGLSAAKVVDPNLVNKKQKGKDVEVQEGWKGRVLPFELVQNTLLADQLAELNNHETRLAEIAASFDETLGSFSEEEKEDAQAQEILNEAGDKFINAAVIKEAKQLELDAKKSGNFEEGSYEARVIQLAAWILEERALKATIKKEADALHLQTKETIEALDDEQVKQLLEGKWITPLTEALHQLTIQQLATFTTKLQALAEKYQITFADNAREIQQTENELASMMDELDANEFDLKGLAELKNLLVGN